MRQPLIKFTASLFLLVIIGWLLFIGRSLIIPLIIALVLWYIINSMSSALRHLPVVGPYLPRPLTILLALFAIFYVVGILFNIVSVNLQQLAFDAPTYQGRLDELLLKLANQLNMEKPLQLSDILPNFSLSAALSTGASVLTSLAGSSSLVFIYVLFMIFEAATFDKKLTALFEDSDRVQLAFAIRGEIGRRMRHYMGIKTGVSIITGFLTYGITSWAGLPYAALFGFIAFLLNYIPTIGSLIAVIFPSLLSLVYFDTLTPFIAITLGLGAVQFILGNLVEPRLMGTQLNISPLVIMISLSFWGALWGVIGMVLCVPLVVLAIIICAQFPSSRPIAILLSGDGNVGDPINLDHQNQTRELT
ncbi:AI-2 transport protein TqsA [Pseudovibrio sp. W64]|uniref:AI-2E family transporter n=1 Tax=Pseudovibrio sp. W64 TaxID=1735583 RepID=UPI0007AEC366|nr:AI-2E family transporter [Pseudovibrio sp. W64]KZK89863.1 AI-2 transport protein TqsA [Pseudovibrio sp. W64]